MKTQATVVLAFAAGLTGGIVSQRIATIPAYAQVEASTANEIRASKFVLVDEKGTPRGAFGICAKDNWPALEIEGKNGKRYRARWDDAKFGVGKPSLLPPK